jgi:hypothetical protein
VLFTFPSRYSFTIGHRGVLRLGGWSPHVQTGLLVPRLTQGPGTAFPIRGCHPLRPAFPDGSGTKLQATGLFRFRSPLLAESLLMSFPPATEMFQFAGFASRTYGFSAGYPLLDGLPHSEIPGSTSARLYPGLFAACHVLHRLSVPRHPPNALTSTLDRKNPSLAETSPARNKPSREDTPEQRTDDRKQMTDVTRLPQPIRRPVSTESNSGPSAPRRQPKAPSAHSLFTLSKTTTRELAFPRKLLFPIALCPPRRARARLARLDMNDASPRSRGCSRGASAPLSHWRRAALAPWWR